MRKAKQMLQIVVILLCIPALLSGCKKQDQTDAYVDQMYQKAADGNIIYSQGSSHTRDQEVFYDTSSSIFWCLKDAGFPIEGVPTIEEMADTSLMDHAGFERMPYDTNIRLQQGDILVARTGSYAHTETYFGSGQLIGARATDNTTKEDQISICEFYDPGWTIIFRPII